MRSSPTSEAGKGDASSASAPRSVEEWRAVGRFGVVAYLTEEFRASIPEGWERLRRSLYSFAATRTDEIGDRADRMLREASGLFIPPAVYEVARAFGTNLTAITYSTQTGDRARIGRLLGSLIDEARKVDEQRRVA